MKNLFRCGLALATILTASASSASTYTDTITLAPSTTSGAFNLPLFDPSLGSLASVTLTISGSGIILGHD